MGIGVDTTDPTMAMAGDTGERRKGQLMRILKFLVLTPRLKLMLMASTPMDMAMFIPTDMDTTSARGLLMNLLFLDLMLMLTLMPTLMLTLMLTLGGAITYTPMAAIMAMVTIPMDTTGAESNQQYKFTKKRPRLFNNIIRDRFLNI